MSKGNINRNICKRIVYLGISSRNYCFALFILDLYQIELTTRGPGGRLTSDVIDIASHDRHR